MIRSNAAMYFTEISKILNEVPRELLLIFKTNDVIRGIEASLGSRADASSFLTMSRSCVRAASRHQYTACSTLLCRTRTKINERWLLMRLSVYECVLWMKSLTIYQYVMSRLSARTTGFRPQQLKAALSSSWSTGSMLCNSFQSAATGRFAYI